jgi:thioredoxin-dependent peroxiredoxin
MTDALHPGSPAPDFDLPADGGGRARLKDYTGRTIVLYFYPKDDTAGCTKEAADFTDQAQAFAAAGAVVIGVSKDSVASHDKFKAKYGLAPMLASDVDGAMIPSYGAWVQKNMYGRSYMGVDRSTFLIDGQGVIRRVWRKVKVPGHVTEVLKALREVAPA